MGMPYQGQISVRKHKALVNSGISAGQRLKEMASTMILAPFTTDIHSEHLETFRTSIEKPRTPAKEPRTFWNSETPEQPWVKTSHITLDYLRIHKKSEEFRPPVVYEKVNEYAAQIILNSDCSTYMLFTDFHMRQHLMLFLQTNPYRNSSLKCWPVQPQYTDQEIIHGSWKYYSVEGTLCVATPWLWCHLRHAIS